jgi:hypothetical protein
MGTIVNSPRVSYRGPNLLINGDFDIWQRGPSGTLTGTNSQFFQSDRWFLWTINLAGTLAISQQTHSLPSAVPDNPKYFHRVAFPNVSAGTNSAVYLSQRIESVLTAAGQNVTVSFYAQCSSGPVDLAVEVVQNYGLSSVYQLGVRISSVGTSWAQYRATFSLATTAGHTVSAGDNLQVNIWLFSNDSTYNGSTGGSTITWPQNVSIDLSHVQVEIGLAATGFEMVRIADTLARCQRYYLRLDDAALLNFIGYQNGWPTATFCLTYPVIMRDTPTANVFGTWSTSGVSSFFFDPGWQGTSCIISCSGGYFTLGPSTGAGVEFNAEL